MDPPPTSYVDRDGAALAYQLFGEGPANLVLHLEITNHLDLSWTDPHIHQNLERLARVSRVAAFQRRGFGLSDPVRYVPTVEQQAEDVLAVMDAAGMDRAVVFGLVTTTGAVAMAAACAPERVSSLILYHPIVEGLPIGDAQVAGWECEEDAVAYWAQVSHVFDHWGSGLMPSLWSESLDTPYNRRLAGMLERSSATPAVAKAHSDWQVRLDVTDVLRAVTVPTHVLCQTSDRLPEAVIRRAAELVSGAQYVELPASAVGASLGQGMAQIVEYAEGVIHGPDPGGATDRSLGTLLFTDIVASTELLATIGDTSYEELRAAHERAVRLAVEQARGRLVKVSGDGTLSIFDSPSRAVRCADTIRREAAALGLQIRAGVHSGEVEYLGLDVSGMTVHIGARVSAAAEPGEVVVSRTVRDILVGSGLGFVSHGERELKGVPGRWQLFALDVVRDQGEPIQAEPSMQTMVDRAAVATARRAPGAMRTVVRMGNAMERRRARRELAKNAD